ncbi:CHRD domain-containing protein [uncultured Polaribacter sp.]|uniref:CHRD domain-containing protein n=1 Tax=uncultured Polaribacter sp. TaxID=174711 RepID=UPI00260F7C9C|nr:CHRD domain-containing protein [uncultured Polaribacter sp.]
MTTIKIKLSAIIILVFSTVMISCSSDSDSDTIAIVATGSQKVYQLKALTDANISGTATFKEMSDASTTIELELQNTIAGSTHPAHIHLNTAVEGGAVAISLGIVEGTTGKSSINIKTKDNGDAITYATLLEYNGYINIHLSPTEVATFVAQVDIGQNELTGELKEYPLVTKDVAGIDGVAKFYERVNGTTLVAIILNGTSAGDEHPAHIHAGAAGSNGAIIIALNPVQGETGISKTQVATLESGAAIQYSDFSTLDAYLNVHLSASNLSSLIAQGNIGANSNTPIVAKNYDVTNSGATAYIFNNDALTNVSNANFTLQRGKTYTFNVNTPGHPFLIKSVQGTGTANIYNGGVTNNGTASGTITFTVPTTAPNTLFYNCEFHGAMTGIITITN